MGLTVPDEDEYSTVNVVPPTIMGRRFSSVPDAAAAVGSASAGPKHEPLIMVDCDLYSQHADGLTSIAKREQPDISPYACFYGGPKQQVLKVGWLDKLSPQG